MLVQRAEPEDMPGWLALAAEVEPLFGPLVNDTGFHGALRKNIARGTAFCVREGDGPPGAPLAGGLLFSPHPPLYRIGWLAVSDACRRRGVGRALLEHALGLVQPPAEITVVTFGEDNAAGRPARRFYERLGFHAAEPAPAGPEGGSRQVYRRVIERGPGG